MVLTEQLTQGRSFQLPGNKGRDNSYTACLKSRARLRKGSKREHQEKNKQWRDDLICLTMLKGL